MEKEKAISIAEAMGFNMDYDQWDVDSKGWIRFTLPDHLDEKNFRLIWYKDDSVDSNVKRGAQIIFKAGQKAKIQQISEYISL